ncbi:SEC-C motif protein [uncultured archaeon]|nr:SEC-C motif protein [uncultured archaeon]
MNNKEAVDFQIHNNSSFAHVRKLATDYKNRNDGILQKEYWDNLLSIKKRAVLESDQLIAKVTWCFEEIGKIQDKYVESFIHFSNDEFYEGWCLLEICENITRSLDMHYQEKNNEFGIEFIRINTKKFQSLFPYKLFISPGFLMKTRCSVCNKLITPRNYCGHENGEIYDGEMCHGIAEDIEPLEVSIVENPVQKYSVIDKDSYDYGVIKYIIKKISSPWDAWDYKKSKKLVPKYTKVGRNELCPCGSEIKFKKCCLRKKQEIDHFDFTF